MGLESFKIYLSGRIFFFEVLIYYYIRREISNKIVFFLNLFIYFWLCWVFLSVRGLSLVAVSGGHSSSRCTGLSPIAASLVAEHRLQTHRLSSCGSRAQLLRRMWDLPRPGLEPVSPALAGRFLTTAPPGKPQQNSILISVFLFYSKYMILTIVLNYALQIKHFFFLKNHQVDC